MTRLAPFLLLVAACMDPRLDTTSQSVIGGEVTQPGEFPGVGALMFDFGDGMPVAGCTGTLIAPDVVLTAAHCVDPALTGPNTPGFTLALDTTAGAVEIVPALDAIQHEQFTLDVEIEDGLAEFFDIALLILAEPVTEVAPVPMPRLNDSDALVEGLAMEIAGYGVTDASSNTGVMFDAETELISLNATEIQVGMGSPQPQNCNGDSGGPGFAFVGGKRRVIGIVSRSFRGFECTMGGVDTRVDAYLTWIDDHLPADTLVPCGSGLAAPCPDGDGDGDDDAGCCASSSRSLPGSAALALVVGLVLVRRRRSEIA